jgi:hypothetical protein
MRQDEVGIGVKSSDPCRFGADLADCPGRVEIDPECETALRTVDAKRRVEIVIEESELCVADPMSTENVACSNSHPFDLNTPAHCLEFLSVR